MYAHRAAGGCPAVLAVVVDDVAVAEVFQAAAHAFSFFEVGFVADGHVFTSDVVGFVEHDVVPSCRQVAYLLLVERLRVARRLLDVEINIGGIGSETNAHSSDLTTLIGSRERRGETDVGSDYRVGVTPSAVDVRAVAEDDLCRQGAHRKECDVYQ